MLIVQGVGRPIPQLGVCCANDTGPPNARSSRQHFKRPRLYNTVPRPRQHAEQGRPQGGRKKRVRNANTNERSRGRSLPRGQDMGTTQDHRNGVEQCSGGLSLTKKKWGVPKDSPAAQDSTTHVARITCRAQKYPAPVAGTVPTNVPTMYPWQGKMGENGGKWGKMGGEWGKMGENGGK